MLGRSAGPAQVVHLRLYRFPLKVAFCALVAVLALSGCSGSDPAPGPAQTESGAAEPVPSSDSAPTSYPGDVQVLSLADRTTWPWLKTRLPRSLPRQIEDLKTVEVDPPGRAVMVYHPPEAWGDPAGWATESVLFYGVDGRWRSLNLGDLGLPQDAGMWFDTYGAGALSPNGRWWAGLMYNGAILVDLASGRHQTVNVGGGAPSEIRWDADSGVPHLGRTPGRDSTCRRPGVGGRRGPVSTLRRGSGAVRTRAVAPAGSSRHRRPGRAPRRACRRTRIAQGSPARSRSDQDVGVSATTGRFAVGHQPNPLNFRRVEILIVDTEELTVEHVLRFDNRKYVVRGWSWLNRSTLLLETSIGVLAWRPNAERLYRVLDVPPAGPGRYWTTHIAPTAQDGHTTTPDSMIHAY